LGVIVELALDNVAALYLDERNPFSYAAIGSHV